MKFVILLFSVLFFSACSTTPQISNVEFGSKEYSNLKGGVVKHDIPLNFKELTNESLPQKILDQVNNVCSGRNFHLLSQQTIPLMSFSVWFLGIFPFIQEPSYRNEYYLKFECINEKNKP